MNTLLSLALSTAVALSYLLVPGLAVGWGIGLQGALRLLAVPALSLAVWAGATWIAIGVHLPWYWFTALPLCVLVTLPFVVGRLLTLRSKVPWPLTPQTPVARSTWVAAGLAACLSLLPFWIGTGATDSLTGATSRAATSTTSTGATATPTDAAALALRPPQTWDAVFHLCAIRYTRATHSASPWEAFRDLNGGQATYYPNVFHNFTALVPGSPTQAYLAVLSAALLLWPALVAGFALLATTRLLGSGRRAQTLAALAGLGAATGANFPANQVANLATPPYLISILALPGLVMLGVALYRMWPALPQYPRGCGAVSSRVEDGSRPGAARRGVVRASGAVSKRLRAALDRGLYSSQLAPWIALAFVIGTIGTAATHPTAVFNLTLLLGPAVIAVSYRGLRAWKASLKLKFFTVVPAVLLGLTGAGLVLWRYLYSMSRFANPENVLWANLGRLLIDYPKGPFHWGFGIGNTAFTLAALYAAWQLFRRRRLLWLLAGLGASLFCFTVAAGTIWPLGYLAAPWYMQFSRIAPLVWLCLWTLGAYGMLLIWERLTLTPALARHPRRQRNLAVLAVAVLALATCAGTVPGRIEVVRGAYDPTRIVRGTMLSDPERLFMAQQAPRLPRGSKIWGASYQGASYWWILFGVPVVNPALNWPNASGAAVLRDLGDGDGKLSEASCDYLRRRGVTHYYADADLSAAGAKGGHFNWTWEQPKSSFVLPRRMLTMVAKNRLSAPGEPFRGQILYRVNLDKCG